VTFTLDSHAARSCPVKTYNAYSGQSAENSGPPTRFPGSALFERKVNQALRTAYPAAQPLEAGPDRNNDEAACLAAMDAGAKLIFDGQLPRDLATHRCGRVPVLVRDEDNRGYYPVLVKYQRVTEKATAGCCEYSTLADPTAHHQAEGRRVRWSWRPGTALQLAHYWLLLQASGHAGERALGGVVGIDEFAEVGPVITWIGLDEPSIKSNGDLISPLQLYLREFCKRVEIAERAQTGDPQLGAEMLPIISRECDSCGWQSPCAERLDPDDLSLRMAKTPLDPEQITVLREAGVSTCAQFAELDLDVFLPARLPLMGSRSGAEERIRTAQRRSRLMLAGVELERTTTGKLALPQAALEIDIDLETSRDDRVYLWGFWVDDKARSKQFYRPFARFEPLDQAAELALAKEALGWLRDLAGGADALVYHYSDYETVRINRLAAGGDPELGWAKEYAQTNFVDLFAIMRANYFSVHGLGLKTVACSATGFRWRDSDPGGLNSMRWFEDAVSGKTPAIREQARKRVLEYNEDDVRATWSLRRWLGKQ
jgi:predicted RecB family nuclease